MAAVIVLTRPQSSVPQRWLQGDGGKPDFAVFRWDCVRPEWTFSVPVACRISDQGDLKAPLDFASGVAVVDVETGP